MLNIILYKESCFVKLKIILTSNNKVLITLDDDDKMPTD